MKIVARVSKALLSAALVGTIGYGMVAVMTPAAVAGGGGIGGPLCGWTAEWDCTLPNGSHVLIDGTICDISRFEARTGAHCVLSGGG